MRNPNTTTTSKQTYSDKIVLIYSYNSASVCNWDLKGLHECYDNQGKVEKVNNKTITVTLPLWK